MSDLIKELRELAASEEVADRAANEIERLTKLNNQKNADIGDWVQMYAEKCSTEPVAWMLEDSSDESNKCAMLADDPDLPRAMAYPSTIATPLITQDQANRIVADFRKRAVEVCSEDPYAIGKHLVEAIEALPLINEFLQGETK